jgi:beta-glucosidase-like glycosyl hydrolase
MTDDLDMGAILNEVTFEQAIQEAVRAGNDLVMICHRLEMVELARQHLEGVERPLLHDALARIERTKKRLVRPTPSASTASKPSTRTSGTCASPPWARSAPANPQCRRRQTLPVELY